MLVGICSTQLIGATHSKAWSLSLLLSEEQNQINSCSSFLIPLTFADNFIKIVEFSRGKIAPKIALLLFLII